MPPGDLMAVLNDHVLAADMVRSLVSQERPLTKHFARELHAVLTRNQPDLDAVTPSGERLTVAMQHGVFKTLPNNPLRPDGIVHEYAPPEQVESEMDQLIAGYEMLKGANVAVRAAWLHHRFAQIHPFQDGNGRVARALTNMVFIEAGLFPLVVSRTDRPAYIAALETADAGDLGNLVDLFAGIQADTILRALSVAHDEETRGKQSTIDAVIGRMVDRLGSKFKDRASVLRGVNQVAAELRNRGRDLILRRGQAVAEGLGGAGLQVRVFSELGGPDFATDHYWRLDLTELKAPDVWINFQEGQFWFRVIFKNAPIHMQYVVSLHHIGRELTGVMNGIAFAEFEEAIAAEGGPDAKGQRTRRPCSSEPFSLTWQMTTDGTWPAFEEWLNETFAIALRHWNDVL